MHHNALQTVVVGLRRRLLADGLDHHAELLDTLAPPDPGRPGLALPVLSHLDRAATLAARGAAHDLAGAARLLGSSAAWTQTASYVNDPPNPTFLDGYAHATLAGRPDDTGPGPDGAVALGLVLLGPHVHYPPHHHPADEVYLPLTDATWLDDDGGYTTRPAGTLLHHRPWQPHGMHTGDAPLLAVYLWTGDVSSPSQFC